MKCTILYEDARSVLEFAPHKLLLACVRDEIGVFDATLRMVEGRPLNGNSNVKELIKIGTRDPLFDYGPVIAVFDLDKASRCYNLTGDFCHQKGSGDPCKLQIRAAIKSESVPDVTVVFLDWNMESLVLACHQALGLTTPPPDKKPILRDKLIHQISNKTQRDLVRKNTPSFDYLVRQVAQWVQIQQQHT